MKRSELTHRRLIHIKKDQSQISNIYDDEVNIEIQKRIIDNLRFQKKRELEGQTFIHGLMDDDLTGL
jgi:hypothetical protein